MVTLNGLVRESPQNPLNSRNLLICLIYYLYCKDCLIITLLSVCSSIWYKMAAFSASDSQRSRMMSIIKTQTGDLLIGDADFVWFCIILICAQWKGTPFHIVTYRLPQHPASWPGWPSIPQSTKSLWRRDQGGFVAWRAVQWLFNTDLDGGVKFKYFWNSHPEPWGFHDPIWRFAYFFKWVGSPPPSD